MIANEALRERYVPRQRRGLTRLLDVVGNLLAGGDELAESLRRIAGHGPKRLSCDQVAHERTLRSDPKRSCCESPVAAASDQAATGWRVSERSFRSQRRPYLRMSSISGTRARPFSVSAYSTRGGTSG